MAINILGTTRPHGQDRGEDQSDQLMPLDSFQSSVEPLSIKSFFEKGRWKQLWEFTQDRVVCFRKRSSWGGVMLGDWLCDSFLTCNAFPFEVQPKMQLCYSAIGSTMDDSDDDCSGPPDMLVLEDAFKCCRDAINNNGACLPKDTHPKIIQWLQHQGAIDVFENGEIVLSREVIDHGLSISGGVLEKTLRTNFTTLEIQTDLESNGWTFVENLASASLQHKQIVSGNPRTYYSLVFHFYQNLLHYEEEGLFHHRQSDKYYLAIEAAVVHHYDEVISIPPYKKAEFYIQLCKHLIDDEAAHDPRLDDTDDPDKPRRAVGSGAFLGFACHTFLGVVLVYQDWSWIWIL